MSGRREPFSSAVPTRRPAGHRAERPCRNRSAARPAGAGGHGGGADRQCRPGAGAVEGAACVGRPPGARRSWDRLLEPVLSAPVSIRQAHGGSLVRGATGNRQQRAGDRQRHHVDEPRPQPEGDHRGVETIGQSEMLCAQGCPELQGFLLGRPRRSLPSTVSYGTATSCSVWSSLSLATSPIRWGSSRPSARRWHRAVHSWKASPPAKSLPIDPLRGPFKGFAWLETSL